MWERCKLPQWGLVWDRAPPPQWGLVMDRAPAAIAIEIQMYFEP